jgi:hypothetical protein
MNLRLHKSSKKSDEISGSSIFFYGKSLLKKIPQFHPRLVVSIARKAGVA